jgi:Na+/melibiose symporter-like transporter
MLIFANNVSTTLIVAAVIIGLVAPVFMTMAGLTIKERIPPSIEVPKMLDGFKFLFKNKPFLMLILANLLTFFRNLVTASHFYVVAFVFYSPGSLILFGLPGAVSGMVGMVCAPWLKKKFEAKQIFIGAIIYHSVFLLLVWLVGPVHLLVTAALLCIAMVAVGILNMVPTLMAADCLDYWEYKTGLRQEGITFSLMGLRSKVSSAFRDFTLTFLLAFFFFNSIDTSVVRNTLSAQFEYTSYGIFLILTILPAILNLSSIIPMFFYDLSGKRLKEIQSELITRRAAKKAAEEGGAV